MSWHKVIIGDSREMREVKDGSVNLIITPSLYPMIEMWDDLFKGMGCNTYYEMHEYLEKVWREYECYRVLVEGGKYVLILESYKNC
ncbi:MAG: hypothetical protein QXX95_05975 [Nitrososphaerales archaeon]